jgi:hypothetical protein
MSELSTPIASRSSGFDATTRRVGAAVRAASERVAPIRAALVGTAVRAVAERTQALAVASEAHQP